MSDIIRETVFSFATPFAYLSLSSRPL